MFRHLRHTLARTARRRAREAGFTLIELLIVIVVLGILAATVIFALSGVTGQSAEAACQSDAKTLRGRRSAYENAPANTTNAPADDDRRATWSPVADLHQQANNPHYVVALVAT